MENPYDPAAFVSGIADIVFLISSTVMGLPNQDFLDFEIEGMGEFRLGARVPTALLTPNIHMYYLFINVVIYI